MADKISQDEYERWAAQADRVEAAQQRKRERAANAGPLRKAFQALGRGVRAGGRAAVAAAEDDARGVPVRIDHARDELIYQGQRESLRGVTATVAAAGTVRSRPTVTRFVAFGLMPGIPGLAALVAQKRVDDRELFLIIDGPDWQWAVQADPKRSATVRAFAAEITTAARQLDRQR